MPERERSNSETEAFSNPLPPEHHEDDEDEDVRPLRNEDFRKLLMTPRATPGANVKLPSETVKPVSRQVSQEAEEDDAATRRRKKKSYYAKLKKLEEETQRELAEKYRDRAAERRDGVNKDYEETEVLSTTADYRAVAPDAKAGQTYAERRKQIIQESKYLGGDMEHTHLVKGLDYALLEKVRAEITYKETEEVAMEDAVKAPAPRERVVEKIEEPDAETQIQFRTKLGRNIFRQVFQSKHPERNELFMPGRMAYVVELDDDFIETDVPTTVIRSKADCPQIETTTTLTTNDIVISKLTQILSYLRQGKRDKKLKKKDKGKIKEDERPKLTSMDESIYGDIGDYMPEMHKAKQKDRREKEKDKERDRDRGRDRGRDKERDRYDRDRASRDNRDRDRDRGRDRGKDSRTSKKSYFEKPAEEESLLAERDKPLSAKDMVKSINEKFSKGWAEMGTGGALKEEKKPATKEEMRLNKLTRRTEVDGYMECYPGMAEMVDTIDDSDDEVDYTKMDMGNKKGPVGRWDFDTQEEYSDYMSNKEALPKAAFQYGVKMADGRKTRRAGPKDEKAELDREWQKIQNIISKRKSGPGDSGEPRSKSAKH